MPNILTVEQAKSKIVKLAIDEAGLTSWKDKTKITVKGTISRVSAPRPVSTPERPVDKDKEGRYRDVWLKQERGDNDPAFLKVTVSKNQWRDDVSKLSEKDIDSEQTFTGVASMWEDSVSGETVYSLYGEIGDGTRTRSGGSKGNWNPRAPIVGMLFNQGMASFIPMTFSNSDYESSIKELGAHMDCVIRAITDKRVNTLLARANPIQKTEDKPKETTEESENTADPFDG